MSHTYRGPTREQHRRTIRRLRQQDRNRQHELTRAQSQAKAMVQPDDLPERKRMEKLWEQSIDFFADSGDTDSAKENIAGTAK